MSVSHIVDICVGYFIMTGMVVFSTCCGKPYRKFMKGMHFGETSIIQNVS